MPVHEAQSGVETAFRYHARQCLMNSRRIALLADFLAGRFGLRPLLQRWMAETPIAHATLLMGKGLFDEQHPNFVGTYSAGASSKEVRQAIEDADRVICVGTRFVDTLTAGFTQQLPAERTLEIQPYASRIGETWFNLPMAQAVSTLRELCLECAFAPPPTRSAGQPVRIDKGELTQESFWQTLQQYLKPGDIVLVDQGPPPLALPRCRFLTARKLWFSRCGVYRLFLARRVWRANRLPRSAGNSDYWRWRGATHDSGDGLDVTRRAGAGYPAAQQ